MPRGFDDKERAALAGSKSKRGPEKMPHELKNLLVTGSIERVGQLWDALDSFQNKPKEYLYYFTKILALVVPKNVDIEGNINVTESDARARLLAKLAEKIGSQDAEPGSK
jgi:hypothetical protein